MKKMKNIQYDWILFDADDTLFSFDAYAGLKALFSTYQVEFNEDDYAEYQKIMNKKYLSFKDESGLIALIEFGSEEFIAVKYTGEAFIKQGLANGLKSDIIAMFMITDTVMSILEKVRF